MVGSWNDREKRISINSGKLRAGMGMNIYIPFGGGKGRGGRKTFLKGAHVARRTASRIALTASSVVL